MDTVPATPHPSHLGQRSMKVYLGLPLFNEAGEQVATVRVPVEIGERSGLCVNLTELAQNIRASFDEASGA